MKFVQMSSPNKKSEIRSALVQTDPCVNDMPQQSMNVVKKKENTMLANAMNSHTVRYGLDDGIKANGMRQVISRSGCVYYIQMSILKAS